LRAGRFHRVYPVLAPGGSQQPPHDGIHQMKTSPCAPFLQSPNPRVASARARDWTGCGGGCRH
jgi:hypothetical protein